MMSSLANIVSGMMRPAQVAAPVKFQPTVNPKMRNPFLASSSSNDHTSFRGKNTPVPGGYFAGYRTGADGTQKVDIVGRKLFILV